MKVNNFQILSETYKIFNSYDTLHIEASDVPFWQWPLLTACRAETSVTSKLNGMIMQKQVLLN